jgi:hypothetical protein
MPRASTILVTSRPPDLAHFLAGVMMPSYGPQPVTQTILLGSSRPSHVVLTSCPAFAYCCASPVPGIAVLVSLGRRALKPLIDLHASLYLLRQHVICACYETRSLDIGFTLEQMLSLELMILQLKRICPGCVRHV